MKIISLMVCFFLLMGMAQSFAQNTSGRLDTYLKNFAKGDNQVKLQLIEEAADLDSAELGPLFHKALDYAISNAHQLDSDSDMKRFTLISIDECADLHYTNARYSILKLFDISVDLTLQEAALNALAVLAKGDAAIVSALNNYLENQNTIYKTGKIPPKKLILICIQTLAALDDASSFTPVFNCMILNYDDAISSLAYKTLLALDGDFRTSIFDIIKRGATLEKKRALEVALEQQKMEDAKKAETAEYALDIALHYTTSNIEDRKKIREIRDIATGALGGFKWGKATGLVISQFDAALLEYDRGVASKDSVLTAINALGSMGTHEAAERLTLYLNILNAFTENKKPYDTQIMLAVIGNLGKLGDKVAYDDLMYTKYLSYSTQIKDAAQKAIKNLKW
jgi:hypothetical protein